MSRRGSILVAVLFMASLLALFVGVASQRLWVASAAGRSANEDIAADVAVRGTVEQLYARTGGRFGDLVTTTSVRFPGLVVDVVAHDEAERVDLNLAAPELITGLFRAVGIGAEQAQTYAAILVDWRRDPKTRDSNATRRKPLVPAHGTIEHIRQLDLVPLIPREALRRIEPFATVTGLRGRVAPLLAPAEVIAALPGIDPGRVADFLGERRNWTGKFETLMTRYGIKQDHVSKEGGAATRLTLVVRIGSHRIRAYELVVAVLPQDDEPYRILSWNGNVQVAGLAGPRR